MDPTRDERIRAIFEEALDTPREGRERVLARRCMGDEELRREVESLLRHVESMGSFLAADLDGSSEQDGYADGTGTAVAEHAEPRRGKFLRAGEVVGQCVIEEFLDRGSSSEVYRARRAGEWVAIKVVPVDAIGAGERARFEEGARIASETRHPHLAEAYEHGLSPIGGGLLYFAMRLVEGPTLQDVLCMLAAGGGPPAVGAQHELVRRIAEIAEALDALHRKKVVHRDVKPANVVLEGGMRDGSFGGRAVLVDFGLLRRFDRATIRSTIWATPAYAGPELLVEGKADARTDVFALGLCLSDLLTAQLPLDGRTLRASHEPLRRSLPGIDRRLEAIVDRACDPLPERRYPDGGALARDSRAWLAGRPLAVRPLTRLVLARRWTSRNPATVLVWVKRGAAALLAGLTLVFALAYLLVLALTVRDARAAWNTGDLERSERAAIEVPAFLRDALLPGELARAIPANRRENEADTTAAVLRASRLEGKQAGLLLAARHLELDGIAAHTVLLRYLAAAVRDGSAEEETRARVTRLVARLFFDRSLATGQEVARGAGIREAIFDTLLVSREREEEIFLVCALGGCGEASVLERLLEWTCVRCQDVRAEDRALLLQTMRALELLVRRSHGCGYRAELARWDWQAWLERCGGIAIRSYEGRSRTPDLGSAFEDLCVAVAVARRVEGRPPLDLAALSRYLWRDLLVAAASDANGLQESLELDCLTADPEHRENPAAYFAALGRALGLRDDPALTQRVLCSLDSGALPASIPLEEALFHLTHGVLTGCSEACGLREDWLPDPDTRLGSWFTAREAPRVILSSESHEPAAALAAWRFTAGAPEMQGAAERLEAHCTTFDDGEPLEDRDGFARLASAGISELAMHFRFAGREWFDPELRIGYQKAARWAFPYFGEAWIAIELDGRPLLGAYRVQDEAAHSWTLPLAVGMLEEDVEHVLTIRLLESSTTTFRIDRVEVGAR